jgi:hypothetical protein
VPLASPLNVVQRLNAAWRGNQIDALPQFFHTKALIVDQGHQPLAVGRDACVESYRAFVSSATVEAYTEGTPKVAQFEGTAVVSYPFEIRYTMGSKIYSESGSDCLVLERTPEAWVVVWRQVVWRAA